MANYSLDDLDLRADLARTEYAAYIKQRRTDYGLRCCERQVKKWPAIAVCGMGRAGKDTAAEYLCAHTGMKYPLSASWMVLPMIAHMIGVPKEQAWEERHQQREFWIKACHAIRGNDYGFLVRLCLGAGDIAVGIRGRLELEEIVRTDMVNVTVWIDNPRVPKDPTVEYGPEDCDLMIPNHGSLSEFYGKLHKLLRLLHANHFDKLY